MPEDKKSLLEFTDAEFMDEAREWARLAQGVGGFGASYRVGRLLSMLDAAGDAWRRASTKIRQLESMLEELFNSFMEEQAKMKVLQAQCDEWKRQADEVLVFVDDADVKQLSEGDLAGCEASLARELGTARTGILDALELFKRLAPGDAVATLGQDIRRMLLDPDMTP